MSDLKITEEGITAPTSAELLKTEGIYSFSGPLKKYYIIYVVCSFLCLRPVRMDCSAHGSYSCFYVLSRSVFYLC